MQGTEPLFGFTLVQILNHQGVPANNDTVARVHSMTNQQRAGFNNYYSNTTFSMYISVLLAIVERDPNSTPFLPTITPDGTADGTPQGTPDRRGNGGNQGGGEGGAGAAPA
jgi:hypothetical protein